MKHLILLVLFSFNSLAADKLPPGIDWHVGKVSQAIRTAQKENRPLFLYWGAVWCPPCNNIKRKVFTQELFQDEVKNFLPVYLDGDLPEAQIWGQKFGTVGYPTMMILDPTGKEVMRLPSNVGLKKYVSLMKDVRSNMESIEQLVEKGTKGELSDSQWRRVANYSWGQDFVLKENWLSDKKKIETYEKLFKNVPERLKTEKSQLFMQYLSALTSEEKAPAVDKAPLLARLKQLLRDQELVDANLESLAFSVKSVSKFFDLKKKELEELAAKWISAVEKAWENEEFTWEERLYSLVPTFYFNELLEKKTFDTAYLEKVEARIVKAKKEAVSEYAHHAVMSTSIWIYKKTGQLEKAKNEALAEIKTNKSPYYFMSYLGSLEKELGNKEEALNWYRKAWESANGAATKFQWGTSYVLSLLEMAPEKAEDIKKSTLEIVDTVVAEKDAFSGRNKKRFDRLSKGIKEWKNETRDSVKSELSKACNRAGKNSAACLSWLENL